LSHFSRGFKSGPLLSFFLPPTGFLSPFPILSLSMQRSGSQYGGSTYGAQPLVYSGQYYQQQPQQPQQPQQIQHQYSGQQPPYVSTPYAAPVPFPQPSPYAAPPPLQPAPSQPPLRRPPRTQTPHPRTRRHTNSGASRNGHARPLRPAIKNVERAPSASINPNALSASISRTRTHSGAAENRPRFSTISRTRTNSGVRVDPGAPIYSSLTATSL
jgi:hypothetical protein